MRSGIRFSLFNANYLPCTASGKVPYVKGSLETINDPERVSIGYGTGTVSYFTPSLSRHYSLGIRFCPMAPLGSLRKYPYFVVLHTLQLVSKSKSIYVGANCTLWFVYCVASFEITGCFTFFARLGVLFQPSGVIVSTRQPTVHFR